MSGYTRVNLEQVKDSAPEFGLGEVHEARFATRPLDASQLGLAFYRMRPGASQPFAHRHGAQEEIYVVLSGTAVADLDGERVELRSLDALRVAPHATRRFEAGPEGAELIAVGATVASEGRNDAEMVATG
ncbi:MAG TPA: cupin domain-containing protein [Gaiellales bacterium]|jgi:mannose-6-phosphate isomerase-like protein (cupin superfamily)